MTEDALEARPITPRSWPDMIATILATPIVEPGGHPSDPLTIWTPPLNSVGLSGIGKSHRIKKIARACGIDSVHTVFTSTKQPASFEGAAVPTPNGIIIECILPAVRKCIMHSDRSHLIFFDEVNGATPRTQGACMSALNDRQVGDHVIPPKTRLLTAMNPASHSAGGFTFTAPMANRLGHVWYDPPTKEEWGRWLSGEPEVTMNLQDAEQRVIDNWNTQWRQVNALAQGFLRRVPGDVLVNQPDPDDPRSGYAWPSYRTWHWALCAITAARCIGMGEEVQFDFVAAFCGEPVMTQWVEWISEADLPTPEDMVTNGWQPEPTRVDRTYAAMHNLMDWLVQMSKTGDHQIAAAHAAKAWQFIGKIYEVGLGDISVAMAAKLHRNKLGRQGTPDATVKAAEPIIHRLASVGLTKVAPDV